MVRPGHHDLHSLVLRIRDFLTWMVGHRNVLLVLYYVLRVSDSLCGVEAGEEVEGCEGGGSRYVLFNFREECEGGFLD